MSPLCTRCANGVHHHDGTVEGQELGCMVRVAGDYVCACKENDYGMNARLDQTDDDRPRTLYPQAMGLNGRTCKHCGKALVGMQMNYCSKACGCHASQKVTPEMRQLVAEMREAGMGNIAIAAQVGLGITTVYRMLHGGAR